MRFLLIVFLFLTLSLGVFSQKSIDKELNILIDSWHLAATKADFNTYFSKVSADFVFLGTAPGERWEKAEFESFCKPYFDKGKAWNFNVFDRNIYIDAEGNIAWFDELLDTWMGVCRGSGVLKKKDGVWKIEHYVLSLTVPNDNIQDVIQINKEKDSLFLIHQKK